MFTGLTSFGQLGTVALLPPNEGLLHLLLVAVIKGTAPNTVEVCFWLSVAFVDGLNFEDSVDVDF